MLRDTTRLATGFDRDYWVGTTRGAIRAGTGVPLFRRQRSIPHDHVNEIASAPTSPTSPPTAASVHPLRTVHAAEEFPPTAVDHQWA